MAEEGQLAYGFEDAYNPVPSSANAEQLDAALYERFKDAIRPAIICQFCSESLADPLIGVCVTLFAAAASCGSSMARISA